MSALLPEGARNHLMQSVEDKHGVLHLLLDVEKAGGGESRKEALKPPREGESKIEVVAARSAVAALIYSVVLESPTELQDPETGPRRTRRRRKAKQGIPRIPLIGGPVLERARGRGTRQLRRQAQSRQAPQARRSPAQRRREGGPPTPGSRIKGRGALVLGRQGGLGRTSGDWVKGPGQDWRSSRGATGWSWRDLRRERVGLGEGLTFGLKVALFTAGDAVR